jgi:hypothetical protein
VINKLSPTYPGEVLLEEFLQSWSAKCNPWQLLPETKKRLGNGSLLFLTTKD